MILHNAAHLLGVQAMRYTDPASTYARNTLKYPI